MTADIAISTYKTAGIDRMSKPGWLPKIPGVRYVISWQMHGDNPVPVELAARDDVSVYRFEGKGISLNRNNSLDHCTGDIIIISDDDVTLHPDAIISLIKRYEEYPEMQLATFRSNNDEHKCFPEDMTRLGHPLPKNYYLTSFELSFRGEFKDKFRFLPELGLNSPHMHGGEEEVLLYSAIIKGYDCRFVSLTICDHPHLSTGMRRQSRENLEAVGCVIALFYPGTAWLRIPLKAWRLWRNHQASLLPALAFTIRGAFRSGGIRRKIL